MARVAALIHRLFGYRYTPRGVSYLPHRLAGHRRSPRIGPSSGTSRP
nr:hypothetical protein [Streptomyces sp. TRM64462]